MARTLPVSADGQLTLPQAVRGEVGLAQGGAVDVRVEDGHLVLLPIGARRDDGWRRWEGVLAGTDALRQHLEEHRREAQRGT